MTNDLIGIENDQSQIIIEMVRALKMARDAFTGLSDELPHVYAVRTAVSRSEKISTGKETINRDLVSENFRLRASLKRMLSLFSEKDGDLVANRSECLGAISSAALVCLEPYLNSQQEG